MDRKNRKKDKDKQIKSWINRKKDKDKQIKSWINRKKDKRVDKVMDKQKERQK